MPLSLQSVVIDGGNEDDVCISIDQGGMGTKLQSFLKLFHFKRAGWVSCNYIIKETLGLRSRKSQHLFPPIIPAFHICSFIE